MGSFGAESRFNAPSYDPDGTYAIAGAFSGVLAYGLLQINGALHSWQYLVSWLSRSCCWRNVNPRHTLTSSRPRGQFIIEGAITVGLAFFALLWLPRRMSQAWFLKEPERAWIEERMARDSGGQDNSALGITKSDIVETCKDWKFCACAVGGGRGACAVGRWPAGAGRSALTVDFGRGTTTNRVDLAVQHCRLCSKPGFLRLPTE
jgi:hypothetical protein